MHLGQDIFLLIFNHVISINRYVQNMFFISLLSLFVLGYTEIISEFLENQMKWQELMLSLPI